MQNVVILQVPFRCAEGPIAILDNCDVTILSNVNERVHTGGGDLETFKDSVRTTQ